MTKSMMLALSVFVSLIGFTACGEESTAQLANPPNEDINLPDASSDSSTEPPVVTGPTLEVECGSSGGKILIGTQNVSVFTCKLTATKTAVKLAKFTVTMRGNFDQVNSRPVKVFVGGVLLTGTMVGRNEAIMNLEAGDNLLPEAVQPENPVTVVLKVDIGSAGQVILGSDFHFEIVSREDVVAREAVGGTPVTVNIMSAVGGTYRIIPFQVVVTGDAPTPGSSYTQAVLSGTQLGRFKIMNNGSSRVFITKVKLADKGEHSGSMSYKLKYSDQDSSNYVANTAAIASDNMDFGDLSTYVVIDGGSYRYFTVGVYSSSSTSGDSWQVAVPAGAVSYMTEEADLGYDGNGSGSIFGGIYGFACEGETTLGTIYKF